MKEVIYLTATRNGISGTVRKNLPTNLQRGEVPIKVTVEIASDAFAPPVIEQHISIQNPYKGIDLEDVHFEGTVITESEAEAIRQKRLEKAAGILRANGFKVEEPEAE
jgi:hypothetical protein